MTQPIPIRWNDSTDQPNLRSSKLTLIDPWSECSADTIEDKRALVSRLMPDSYVIAVQPTQHSQSLEMFRITAWDASQALRTPAQRRKQET